MISRAGGEGSRKGTQGDGGKLADWESIIPQHGHDLSIPSQSSTCWGAGGDCEQDEGMGVTIKGRKRDRLDASPSA